MLLEQGMLEYLSMSLYLMEGGGQLFTLIEQARKSEVTCVVFSATGQLLSNNYSEYNQKISMSDTESTEIIGVGVCGEDEVVRLLTKKFSLAK